jgi:hypothetical protein
MRFAIPSPSTKQNDEKMRIHAQNADDAKPARPWKADSAADARFATNAKVVADAAQSSVLLVIRMDVGPAKSGDYTIDVSTALEPRTSKRVKAG